jgi:hypothetical protein
MWRTTIVAAEAILADRACPVSLRTWARHLRPARESTVLENHLLRIAAPVWAVPLTRAPRALGVAFSEAAAKGSHETWGDKRRRSRKALVHAFMSESAHIRTLQRSDE